MKRGLEGFENNEMAALRVAIAFIALSPIALRNLKLYVSPYGKWVMISAIFGNLIPAFLFAKAQTVVSSGLAGMLNSLTPLFTLIFAFVFFKVKLTWLKTAGVLIGLTGSVSIIYLSKDISIGTNYIYSFLIVAATLCYGISVNVLKEKLFEISASVITSLAFFSIGPPCIVYLLLFTDFTASVATETGIISLGYIAVLAIVGTAMAVILFNELIKHTTSIFASSVTYFIPFVSLLWGVFDGEVIHMGQVLSFLLVLCGVYLVTSSRRGNLIKRNNQLNKNIQIQR